MGYHYSTPEELRLAEQQAPRGLGLPFADTISTDEGCGAYRLGRIVVEWTTAGSLIGNTYDTEAEAIADWPTYLALYAEDDEDYWDDDSQAVEDDMHSRWEEYWEEMLGEEYRTHYDR